MRYISIFIITVFLFSSCKDFFNQVVEVKVPDVQPRIVMDSRVAAGDDGIDVFVSRSRGILDDSEYSYNATIQDSMYYIDFNGDSVLYVNTYFERYDTVPGVTLEIFKNGVSIGQIEPTQAGYYHLDQQFPVDGNDEYQLKAAATGYEPVDASASIPVKPVIESLNFTPGQGGGGPFGDQLNSLDIVIDDNNTAPNYYNVEVFIRYDSIEPYFQEYIMSNDPLVSNSENGGILISDESFNGNKYNLRVGTYTDLLEVDAKVVLRSISKDYYLFSKSVELYRNANGNPFAEPVLLHSNVNNGYGLFEISNSTEKKVE